jgi:hypothetical protein
LLGKCFYREETMALVRWPFIHDDLTFWRRRS